MLPKKSRRKIIVDNVLYYYIVKGYVYAIIQNSVTGEKFQWGEEVKPKWKIQITPSIIKKVITAHNEKDNSNNTINTVVC